jgi:hypothetical protein
MVGFLEESEDNLKTGTRASHRCPLMPYTNQVNNETQSVIMNPKFFTAVKLLIASTIGVVGLALLSGIVTVDVEVKYTPQTEQSTSVTL